MKKRGSFVNFFFYFAVVLEEAQRSYRAAISACAGAWQPALVLVAAATAEHALEPAGSARVLCFIRCWICGHEQ